MLINTARFNPNASFTVRKGMLLSGVLLEPGASFPKSEVPERRLRQLYHNRLIVHGTEQAPEPSSTVSAAVPPKGKKHG